MVAYTVIGYGKEASAHFDARTIPRLGQECGGHRMRKVVAIEEYLYMEDQRGGNSLLSSSKVIIVSIFLFSYTFYFVSCGIVKIDF